MANRSPFGMFDAAHGSVLGAAATGSVGTHVLDSALVYLTSGDCVGMKFCAPGDDTVIEVYFLVTAVNGSPGALTCILAQAGSSVTTPGTQITSVTATPSGANTWVKFTFSSSNSISAGTVYWVVVGDAAGSGSNYWTLKTRSNGGYSVDTNASSPGLSYMYTSTAGFSSAGSSITPPQAFLIKFGSGTFIGQTGTLSSNDTSNSLERGLRVGPFDDDFYVEGLVGSLVGNHSAFQIRPGSAPPGGAIIPEFNGGVAFTLTSSAKTQGGFYFPETLLRRGQIYRATLTYSASSTSPGYIECEGAASGDYVALLNGMPGCGRVVRTIDNGSSGWTDADNSTNGLRVERIALLVSGLFPRKGLILPRTRPAKVISF